ncbi:MAG: hypothetical protein ACHQQP_06470, partial [Gemmatimonadales bacterium]
DQHDNHTKVGAFHAGIQELTMTFKKLNQHPAADHGAAIRAAAIAIALGAIASPAAAQQRLPQRPPQRPLGQAVSTSAPIGSIAAIRALSNGDVLVNDPVNFQVLLLDSTMKVIRVVADTTEATQKAYGTVDGGLVPYRGDSTLFVDPASYSMLVIDPAGNINRVIAAPRPAEVSALLGGTRGGDAGFDANGLLVYRNTFNFNFRSQRSGTTLEPPQQPDTSPIVRFNLATRKEDTAAFTHVATTKLVWTQTEAGRRITPVINPIQVVDDWSLLPDGTIAIVRRNYHVDYIASDGTKTSGPSIPFDWQRLTDSMKVAIIDSVKQARVAVRARTGQATVAGTDSSRPQVQFGGGRGFGGGFAGGFRAGAAARGGRAPGDATPGGAPGGAARITAQSLLQYVEPKELPDYKPAFASGAVHSDAEGKLWVRIITDDTTAAGPAYDVIDRSGKLIDCVVTPKGTTIAGFGPGGTVYLGVRDKAGVHLVRAREK